MTTTLLNGPVSLVVVHADLHLERGEGGEGLVPVLVGRRVGRSHHLLLPASGPVGAESHDVAEALSVLELLRHRLEESEGEKQSLECKVQNLAL